MGARARQAGELERVADLRMARSRPPSAHMQPAGTVLRRSSPWPIIRYSPSTCQACNLNVQSKFCPLAISCHPMWVYWCGEHELSANLIFLR